MVIYGRKLPVCFASLCLKYTLENQIKHTYVFCRSCPSQRHQACPRQTPGKLYTSLKTFDSFWHIKPVFWTFIVAQLHQICTETRQSGMELWVLADYGWEKWNRVRIWRLGTFRHCTATSHRPQCNKWAQMHPICTDTAQNGLKQWALADYGWKKWKGAVTWRFFWNPR